MTGQSLGSWTTGTGDAESMLAEARKALFVMVGFLALLWIIQIVNVADHYGLVSEFGIKSRSLSGLPDIFTSPFIHLSWTHIEANSGPLFVFGFLAAYRGVVRFLGLTVLVIITSGFAAWLTAPTGSVGVGASGVVFGYLGYILVRGLFDRHLVDLMIGAVMALCFAYQFTVLLPHAGIGWQDHVGGLVGGVVGGWVFRDRARVRARKAARLPKAAKAPTAGQTGRPATANAPTGTGTAVVPATGAGSTVPYSGPRADLHKELDDLGL
jgi:membrane associated rhomboid family serine protease